MEKTIKKIISFVGFSFFSLALPLVSRAAILFFSPDSGSYKVGSSITISVYVSSADKIMNAASGVISFPTDLLSVTSISKNGSLIDFWAQEPSFSNTAGTVNFEGVLLPPGYNSTNGKIITIVFKTKAAGVARLNLSSGQVLAADGMGTDITSSLGSAVFNIKAGEPDEPIIIAPISDNTPKAPEISSVTHPDQTKWYTAKDAMFSWGLPNDVTGSSLLIGRQSEAYPTVLYDPPISSKTVKDLEDGVWYFHVQLRNVNGMGKVGRYKIQIDTEKPIKFDIREIARKDPTDPVAKFVFDAKDKTSGIDHYEIQIDGNFVELWKDDGSGIYKTQPIGPGDHAMIVKVFDKAGNYLVNSVSFYVKGLEAPVIIDYPSEIQSGEPLIVKGTSKYPNEKIRLWLQRENQEPISFISNIDKDGKFSAVAGDKLKDGLYSAWVEVVDGRGARSEPSLKVSIVVRPSTFIRFGSIAINFLTILIPLIALMALLVFLLWYAWFRFFLLGKKIKKEVREVEDAVHKAFDLLKESIREQLKILEGVKNKRELTEEEEKINKQLKKDLEDAESYIKKEIDDIEVVVNKNVKIKK